MVFKLLRIDKTDSCKIQLEIGKHMIGRGKFLHCEDKRVSRKHGELEVTRNSVTLIALHTNPCFYVRKGTLERDLLKQNDRVDLANGDKFGLLPIDCWYEVLYLPDDDQQPNIVRDISTDNCWDKCERTEDKTTMLEDTEAVAHNDIADRTASADSLILAPQPSSDNGTDPPQPPDQSDKDSQNDLNDSTASQSLLQNINNLPMSAEIHDNSQSLLDSNPEDITQTLPEDQSSPVKVKTESDTGAVQPSPLKRPLPSTSDVKMENEDVAKRVKADPDGAIPGSSNGIKQDHRSHSSDSMISVVTDEIINKINAHINETGSRDRWDHTSIAWASVIRSLPKDQQVFAEKLINDVLFEAQLNMLCRESHLEIGAL